MPSSVRGPRGGAEGPLSNRGRELHPEAARDQPVPGAPRGRVFPRSLSYWAILVYLAFFVIRPWEVLLPELALFRIERLVALLVIAVVVFAGRLRLSAGITTFPVYIFFAVIALSTVFGVNPAQSWIQLYLLFTVIVVFVLLISVVRSPYELVFYVASYIAVLGIYLSKAQWEYWVHDAAEYEAHIKRLRGIEYSFGDPNTLGPAIALTMPFVFFLFRCRGSFTARWPALPRRLYPVGLIAYAILAVSSVLMTKSRSAALVLVLFALLLALRKAGPAKKLYRLALVALLLAVSFRYLPQDIQVRLSTIWDSEVGRDYEYESARGRWEGFLVGLEIFERYPLAGIGPGVFGQYRRYQVDGSRLDAHNLAAQVLAETGLLGTLSFGAVLIGIYLACRRLRARSAHRDDPVALLFNGFSYACRDVLVLLLFWGFFQHNLYEFQWYWLAAFSLLADTLFRAHSQSALVEAEAAPPRPIRVLGGSAVGRTPHRPPFGLPG